MPLVDLMHILVDIFDHLIHIESLFRRFDFAETLAGLQEFTSLWRPDFLNRVQNLGQNLTLVINWWGSRHNFRLAVLLGRDSGAPRSLRGHLFNHLQQITSQAGPTLLLADAQGDLEFGRLSVHPLPLTESSILAQLLGGSHCLLKVILVLR